MAEYGLVPKNIINTMVVEFYFLDHIYNRSFVGLDDDLHIRLTFNSNYFTQRIGVSYNKVFVRFNINTRVFIIY